MSYVQQTAGGPFSGFVHVVKARAMLILLVALALGVAAYEWHSLRAANAPPPPAARPSSAAQPSVVLAEGRIATYPGAEVTVSSELGGRIVKLAVKERDVVKAGDLLAEIDVKEQRAGLDEALARVKEAESEMAYLGRERGRAEQLFKSSVVAEAELDRRRVEAATARQRRSAFLATANRLATALEKAKLVAPIDGTVTTRFADAGEMLAPGAPVVTVANLERVRIEAEVGEFDAGRVKVGASAIIRAEGYEGQRWKGTVEEIPDQVVPRQQKPLDPARPVDTRVLVVKVRLDEVVPLRLGQRVEVEIERRVTREAEAPIQESASKLR